MPDNPNEDPRLFRLAPVGSLHGYTDIDTSGDGTVLEGTVPPPPIIFSFEQAVAELGRLINLVDSGNIDDMRRTMLRHIQNRDNPHKDKIVSLIENLGRDLLGNYMPGTVPQLPLHTAFIAEVAHLSALTTDRSSSIVCVEKNGRHAATAAGKVARDWSKGRAAIPAWGAYGQTLTNVNARTTGEGTALNGSLDTAGNAGYIDLDGSNNYAIVWENSALGRHGYQVSVAVTSGQEYTTSIHMYPILAEGYVAMRCMQDPANVAYIDLATGDISDVDGVVYGCCDILPSGWWRIGLQFLATATETTTVEFVRTSVINGTLNTQGVLNRALFCVYGIQNTTTAGMAPYLPSGTASAGAEVLQFPLSGINLSEGMFYIEYIANRSLLVRNDTLLAINSAVSLYHKGQTLQSVVRSRVPPVSVNITPTHNGENAHAVSYSASRVIAKHSGSDRQTTSGSFNALSAASLVTLGSFNGYITGFGFYNTADDGFALEFLTGEQ